MKSKDTKNKKVTIDKLAEMVQRGFLDQNKRLKDDLKNFATKDDMLTGFDKIFGKLDKIHPHT